jgi:hypothetical protein
MSGLREDQRSNSGIDSGIYAKEVSKRVYAYLLETAGTILRSGHHVILDAAFLQESDRAKAIGVAGDCRARSVLIAVDAPLEVLRERVQSRAMKAVDASEAGPAVLEHQLTCAEPMTAGEKQIAIFCDTTEDVDIDKLAARIRKRS